MSGRAAQYQLLMLSPNVPILRTNIIACDGNIIPFFLQISF